MPLLAVPQASRLRRPFQAALRCCLIGCLLLALRPGPATAQDPSPAQPAPPAGVPSQPLAPNLSDSPNSPNPATPSPSTQSSQPSQSSQSTQPAASGIPPATAPVLPAGSLEFWLASPHRAAANFVRDGARHPLETLDFFGVQADSTVVELLPGSGAYYLEILAPYLKPRGRYVAAGRDDQASAAARADHQKLLARLKAEPELYDAVVVTQFSGDRHEIASPGSADFVLTFRNLHNWLEADELDSSLRAINRALKPGGVLGVVDHRGRTDLTQAQQMKSGYVREDLAIKLIEQAGFRLAARSEINANPKDSKDYPEGVWTLPPSYRLKDQDRARYQAIGESDRFTLRFIKIAETPP